MQSLPSPSCGRVSAIRQMTKQEHGFPVESKWPEFKLSNMLLSDAVKKFHESIDNEWDFLQRSACQTAAGRALWKHVIHDPVADVLAGEKYLTSLHEKMKKDHLNNAREISGVILDVRTLWFDSKIEAALKSFNGEVLLGANQEEGYRMGEESFHLKEFRVVQSVMSYSPSTE